MKDSLERLQYATAENRVRIERARELAAAKGVSASQVALAFVLAQPFPTLALIGPSTVDLGPDLTHLYSRLTIAGASLTHDQGNTDGVVKTDAVTRTASSDDRTAAMVEFAMPTLLVATPHFHKPLSARNWTC